MNRSAILSTALISALALSGCQHLNGAAGSGATEETAKSVPSLERSLEDSAKRVSESMHRLSMIEQTRTPVTPNGSAYTPDMPPEFATPVTLNWVGPAEQVAEIVTRQIGWQFAVSGNKPATPIVVNIDANGTYAVDVLRNIGLQTAKRGVAVVLDGEARRVEFRYQGR